MGGRSQTKGCAALELSQISDRPRRQHRRRIPGERRTDGYACENKHRSCARRSLTTAFFAPELTCPTDKLATGEKAVAVAARVQLSYCDQRAGMVRNRGLNSHGRARDQV